MDVVAPDAHGLTKIIPWLAILNYITHTKTQPMRLLLILGLVSLLYSQPSGLPKPRPNTPTWVPIYGSPAYTRQVVLEAPRPIGNSGKIYAFGNYLLQVEKDSGIHIIDYSDRSAPQKVGFLRSMFCSEMAIKGQYLYVNNLDDLVVLNIANPASPVETSRVKGAFPFPMGEHPPGYGVFFECPDRSKGEVIGWKQETRDYPRCYR